MSKIALLPYDPRVTTHKDVEMLQLCLTRRNSPIRLITFPGSHPPICLADITDPKTITVTLDQTSSTPIFDHIPGPKFFSRHHSKLELFQDLVKADIPAPYSRVLSPEIELTEELFGPYVTVKTMLPGTSRAKGIITLKTHDFQALRDRIFERYKKDIQRGYMPLVQQYIPTGSRPNHVRVTTFLGAPIVCHETVATGLFDPNHISGLVGGEATSNSQNDRIRRLNNDPEFVEFAKIVAQAFPETSVLSIDMVRCQESKKIYCIEVNLGNLCVLSSPACSGLRKALGAKDVYRQFGSYDRIAQKIINKVESIS